MIEMMHKELAKLIRFSQLIRTNIFDYLTEYLTCRGSTWNDKPYFFKEKYGKISAN